jgi:hypothetical protein
LSGSEELDEELDIVIVGDEAEIPPKLRSTLDYCHVTREFVTEDEMDDPRVMRTKVDYFLRNFGIDPAIVKFFVLLIRDPQTNWGQGFPYQVKIYAFPKYLYELEQKYANHPDFDYIWARIIVSV